MFRKVCAAAVAVAVPVVLTLAPTAAEAAAEQSSTETKVPYVCRTWLNGEVLPVTGYERGFKVTAPTRVAPGKTYITVFDPDPIYPVPAYNEKVVDVRASYALPENASISAFWLEGAKATDRVWREGDELVVLSPDAKPGGVEFDLPTLKVVLKAPSSGTLISRPGGSSFEHLSFGWKRLYPGTQNWDPFQCYADPARPVEFSSTQVTAE